ncbi:Hypothetical protein PFR_JS9-2_1483 [Propionibacterium freudenreichii]|jgi:hypothetical protein|uniref:hypothetical protein n=1 Tax=Propionibacterium freudenreichii TaxID=1744 RepID=UPI000BC2CC39|nr:hypothetical protein [Propionibacterium freudenreichii]SBN95767.1 Hypothetical protein PFR_JS12-2_1383 [Propionibacterium freudenreichii]SCC97353.1 Hypothetical protein PFR_JS12-1_1385 [Propionibacterium freudenreichii]SCQ62638.1 Hypothetical protein PFR_JS9-1_1485 [Propionibacterium freudenreichii]SCQ69332.1 Hypothetical protein PFR_JS9-2_1483 [Propionibacterium freudenreichii]
MPWTTIRDHITLPLRHVTMTGALVCNPAHAALILVDRGTGEDEVLTVDLTAYGHVALPGEVFVKDWSEHSGLAATLEAAGIAREVQTLRVGPFRSTAYRMELLPQAEGR